MVQIINTPSVGGRLGEAFGNGLTLLAQSKLGQLQERNQQSQLSRGLQALNISPQEADSLSLLPPDILKSVITDRLASGGQETFARGIEALLGGGQTSQQGLSAGQENPNQPVIVANQVPETPPNNRRNIFEYARPPEEPTSTAPKPPIAQPKPQSILPPGARLNEKQASTLAKLALQKQSNELKEANKLKKLDIQEEKELRKKSREYLEDLQTKEDVAKFSDARLDKMEALVKKGGLPTAAFYNLLKNLEEHVKPGAGAAAGGALGYYLGIPGGPAGSAAGGAAGAAVGSAIGGILSSLVPLLRSGQRAINPNSEEFEKLAADFVKDAKGIFGSRLTDADLNAFFQTIPTLANTDSGKLTIINNMRSFNEASRIKNRAAKQIIKENGGIEPPYLRSLVDERTSDQLDKWATQFSSV